MEGGGVAVGEMVVLEGDDGGIPMAAVSEEFREMLETGSSFAFERKETRDMRLIMRREEPYICLPIFNSPNDILLSYGRGGSTYLMLLLFAIFLSLLMNFQTYWSFFIGEKLLTFCLCPFLHNIISRLETKCDDFH